MAADSLLKQYSDERAALVQGAVSKAAAIILGRRRVLSGIRWRDDLIVTAAEAIAAQNRLMFIWMAMSWRRTSSRPT